MYGKPYSIGYLVTELYTNMLQHIELYTLLKQLHCQICYHMRSMPVTWHRWWVDWMI